MSNKLIDMFSFLAILAIIGYVNQMWWLVGLCALFVVAIAVVKYRNYKSKS